jgi:integrase
MLTTLKIKSAQPTERAYKLADTGGLFLLVQPNGSKLWRYKFRLNGIEGLHALGSYPEVSLADVRHEHVEARKLVAKGVHPAHARRQERDQLALAELHRAKGSFAAVAADWNAATSASLRHSTIVQRDREIKNDLMPRFKDRAVASVTRLELTAALKQVESRAPEVARNLRNYLWGIFEYAIDTGLLENNPVPPVRVLRKRNQGNHPALSMELLGEFLRKLDATTTINEQTRVAMLLVVLTACRKAEVTGARWSEFNLELAEWEVPADRMKAGRAHWVPLSRQAMLQVEALRSIVPASSAFLFPNRVDPKRPMADRSLNALMERLGFGGDGTPHGMRAAFSTHFNSVAANVDVIEHCLAHVPNNRVRAVYNRHAYQAERRELLQAWADQVDKVRLNVSVSERVTGSRTKQKAAPRARRQSTTRLAEAAEVVAETGVHSPIIKRQIYAASRSRIAGTASD